MRALILQRLLAVTSITICGSGLAADRIQPLSLRNPAVAPPATANADSGLPILSTDGRFVLFASSADDLLVMSNGARIATLNPPPLNVFLRDRTNATTTLVSVNLTGVNGGNGDSLPAGLSTDGRYVLFESSASDLVFGDANGVSDVFVRDIVTATIVPVSVNTNDDLGNGASRKPVMTPDGRYVAFVSAASNLVTGDTNGVSDVFLRDMLLGTTILASVVPDSVPQRPTIGNADAPEITPDGRYVAFYRAVISPLSFTTNINEIYVRDVVAGTTVRASVYARAALNLLNPSGSYNSLSFGHSISADGQFVAYETIRGNGIGQAAPRVIYPGIGVILRYNLGSGLTDVVSANAAVPIAAPEDTCNPVMTPDGRFVAFVSNSNIGTKTNTCIRVWDAQTGTNVLASGDITGVVPTNSTSGWPAITPDGRFVAFLSNGTNLVTNSLTGEFHLYVRDLQAATTTLVDAGINGLGAGVNPLMRPRLSDDGRFIAFEAPDGGLVPNDSNGSFDVFVSDTASAATELISQRDPALPSDAPNGPSLLSLLSLSGEGSLVAFASDADNLAPSDTNGYRDVFVRDLLADTTLLVSAGMSGVAPGNGISYDPAITSDGRYVAFTSTVTNLVTGDANKVSDVFVRDLVYETTDLMSVNASGFSGNGASYSPMISTDGRAVLFHSLASNLAPGALSSGEKLYWRDLWSGTTSTVITSGPTNLAATMTADGHFAVFGGWSGFSVWDSQTATIVFTSTFPNSQANALWASADGNRIVVAYSNFSALYVMDRTTGGTNLLGTIRSASLASPCFSADARYLAYAVTSANVATDTNGLSDVYLYDCQTGSNVLVSQAFNAPASADGDSDSPVISADGRFVAYRSAASNLVPNDANGVPDIFLWDRITGATMLMSISLALNSTADNRSLRPVFSADGRMLVFESWASDMLAGDLNRASDLFAVDIYASGPIPLFKAAIIPGADPTQGVWISWPVIPDRTYRVDFKDRPGDPVWQPLGGNVTILGTQGYIYDLAVGSTQRFYRVVAQ